jgi:hypothetical protein
MEKITMKKLGLSVAIATALGLTACGGGGGGGSSPPAGATVSGAASKGIVIGGKVNAYLFKSDGTPDTATVATATTDANGDYSLAIPAAHNGKPLYIVVDDNDGNATMKCDIAPACDTDGDGTGDVDFGETFNLAAGDLVMSAVLPESTATVAINITPLTTVAAELAKSRIGSGASDSSIAVSIATANSQVSTTFGLGADITKIPVVDLTDADDVAANAGTNDAAINYAAINAALVSAKQSDANGEGSPVKIGAAITQFAQEVVSDGGLIANASNAGSTSLKEIFTAAVAVIDLVKIQVSDTIVEDGLDQQLTDATDAPLTTEGELDEPSDTSGLLGNYAKVKAFVEELRELGTAIDSSLVGDGESAQTVKTILDGFDDQIDFADTASSTDAEATINALGDAMNAIVDVYDANVEEMGVDSIAAGNYVSPEDITVVVAVENGVTTMSVDTNLNVDVDEQIISVATQVTAVLTSLVINDNVIETPGEEFTNANVPGTYIQEDGDLTANVVLNANGTGTFQEEGEDAGPLTWTVVDGVLEMSWLDGETTNVDRYTFVGGRNVWDGEFSIEYLIDGETEETYSSSWERTGYDGTETESGSLGGEIDFNVSGVIAAGSVSLGLINGTVQATLSGSIDESEMYGEQSYTSEYDNEGLLTNLLFDLDATLAQVSGGDITDPLMFTGGIELSLSRLDMAENGSYDSIDEYTTTINSLGVFGFSLAGNVANTSGEEFDFSFDLELDGTGVPAYSESFEETFDGFQFRDDKVSTSGGETESNYVDVSLNLAFSAKLSGITDALDVDLTLTRSGYDDVSAVLDLSYPGRDIQIRASAIGLDTDDSASGDMTITNVNDGIVIFVTGDESVVNEDEEVTVEIRMDTNADGTVDEDDFLFAQKVTRNNIELLEYVDESDPDNIEFESLF